MPGILDDVLKELKRAKKKHPRWPVHITAQAGVIVEEAGELMREALNHKYEKKRDKDRSDDDRRAAMRKEAIQVCASAIRFLENLK